MLKFLINMKKIILILISVLALDTLSAQYYYVSYPKEGKNPGEVNTDGENPSQLLTGWSSIWTGPATSNVEVSPEQTIPFTFKFNGNTVTSYKACNAGFVTFDVSSPLKPSGFSNLTLPNANIPDNSVCILGMKPINNATYKSAIVTKTFGTAPNRQHWIQFNFFSEPNIQNGWTYWSVVLEETTNNIYIVDMKTLCVTSAGQICSSNIKMSAGIQIDAGLAYTIAGSPNLPAGDISQNLFTAKDNSYYMFVQGTQAANDAAGYASTIPDFFALTMGSLPISGKFKNMGSAAISSADINYSINNGAAVTAAASSVNIAKNGTATVTSPTNWTPSAAGTYKITVWLSNLNGSADPNGANDSVTKTITVLDNYVIRKPLHEVFTSSTCGPCVAGNRNTDENIFPLYNADDYTVIKYQMSWPGAGDPYYTAEGGVRRTLYGVNSIPNMQVDGGWNGNAQIYTSALYDQFKGKPSFIKIDATHTINFKKVTVNVKITPLANYNNPNLKLFVVINEKLTTKNVATNGETEFRHVMKKMLPDANGTVIGSITKDNEKVFPTFNFTVPGVTRLPLNASNAINVNTENSFEELQDCEVVVFIQDVSTKEVYQSANSVGTVLAIDNPEGISGGISVYPNPATDMASVKFNLNNTSNVNIKVYNAMGQLVETLDNSGLVSGTNDIKMNTQSYAKGMYTVQIDGEGFTASEKFIVQ